MKDNRDGFLRTVFRTTLGLGMALVAWSGTTVATAQPSNDNFASALEVIGTMGTTNVSSTGGTAEFGEPSHAGVPARASVWFKWTAPKSGKVQFDTYGSGFNTVLAVYTGGNNVGQLDFVIANNDATPAGQSFVGIWTGPSLVKFNAKEGTTYFIAVDGILGFGGFSGPVALSWAYHSAGVFRFTTDVLNASETETITPLIWDSTFWSADGIRVTVTRVAGSSGRCSVDLIATDGTAVLGTDYSFAPTTLVFDDWEMSKSIIIPVWWNSGVYETLSFSLTLTNAQLNVFESLDIQAPRVDPGHSTQTVNLLNYDLDPTLDEEDPVAVAGIVNFAKSFYRTRESVGNVLVSVGLQGGNRPRTISWRIDKASRGGPIASYNTFGLEAGSDYATPDPVNTNPATDDPVDFRDSPQANDENYGGTFTWNQGTPMFQTISIPINNDNFPEFNEDIKIILFDSGQSSSAIPGEVNEATITILHDDYPAGALDDTHNRDFSLETDPPEHTTPGADGSVYASAIQSSGKCVIAGDFTSYNTVSRNRIARMNADGSHDSSFNPGSGANSFITAMALASGDQLVIGGGFTSYNGQFRSRIARLNSDGSLDTSFNPGLGADNTVWSVAVQGDGKVLIGGEFTSVNGFSRPFLARLNADGSVDETFSMTNALNGPVEAIAVHSDGTVYVAGRFTMAGSFSRNSVARLNADGSLDLTFSPRTAVDGPVYAVALQSDGRLIIGGDFDTVDLRPRQNIARLNTDGTLDTTFDPGSGVDDSVYALALQGDGRIFVGGAFLHINGTRRVGVARLLSNGQVDTSFMDTAYNHFAGIFTHYSTEVPDSIEPRNYLLTLAIQDDGNLIVGGSFHQVGGGRLHPEIQVDNFDFYQVRFDEAVDGAFGYSRQAYRNRFNVARLLGGGTDGPGNVGFLTDSYSIDETAGFIFVKTIRENGTLGVAETTFSLPPTPEGAAAAKVTTDYVYNNVNPFYDTSWTGTRNLADGIHGTNNLGLMVINGSIISLTDDIRVTIPRNLGIQGDRTAQMKLDLPSQSEVFFLGGENVPLGAALGRTSATLQINDVDTSPGVIGFSVTDYTVNENGTNAVITLTRTNGSSGVVTVIFATANGTAMHGTNYTAQNKTVTFAQGITNQTVLIPIIDNTTVQNDDLTVLLTLKSPTGGATLGLTNAVLSIIDNDFLAGRLNFASTNIMTNEYAGTVRLTITRTGGNLGILDVQSRTLSGTAQEGVHFVGKTNALHWDSGDTSPRFMDVTLLPDGLVTSNLNFKVLLANPTTTSGTPIPMALGARTNATVTIANEDFLGNPQFVASTFHVDETGGFATITVQRVSGSAETISLNFATSDGTAVSSGSVPNYVATNGTLLFGPGVVSQSFTVPILNDGVANPSPFFFTVSLSGLTPAGAALGFPASAQVVINDAQSMNEPAGTTDPTFSAGIGFNADVFALALEPTGSVVAGGDFTALNGLPQNRLARLFTNGVQDVNFMAGLSGANGVVRTVISQTDTRLLVGGQFTVFNGVNRNYVTRLNPNGSLDTTFDPGSGADAPVYSAAEAFLSGARKLYLGGSFTTFNGNARPGLVRLNDDGTVDTGFNTGVGVDGPVFAIAVYPTNTIHASKVLIGGAFTSVNGVPRAGIARVNPNGTLDTTFNPGTGANGTVRTLAIQPDGKVLMGGAFTTVAGVPLNRVARLNLNGTVDSTFTVGVGMNDIVYAIAVQQDNRIVVTGEFTQGSGVTRRRITRLMPNGAVDPTINFGSGANGFIAAVAVQPDGKLVVAGGFTEVQGQTHNRIARIFGGATTGPGQIEFIQPQYVVNENGTNALITLRRVGGTSGTGPSGTNPVTVNVLTADITAVAGVNYMALNQPVSFPVGEVETSVLLPVQQDFQITEDLYAYVYLDAANELLGPQPVTFVQIVNVDSALRFSAPTYVRNEDAIDGVATIQILREGSTQGTASVLFTTTTNGTAVAGVNYLPLTNTVVFQPGDVSKNVRVTVLHNPVAEGDRTVTMELSEVAGSVLLIPFEAELTIQDVDLSPGQLLFSAPQYTVSEGAGTAVITVLRTNGTTGVVQVNVATVSGTALPGVRYLATNVVLNFADGQTSRSFPVGIIEDSIVQGNESLSLVMSNPTGGATLLAPTTVPLTILDNDVAINFTSPAYVVNETAGLVFVGVQRINGSNGVATVNLLTVDGTAKAGTNYTADNRVLTFNPGETLKSVGISVARDPGVTGDLTFSVLLTNASAGVQLAPPNPAQVILVDSDAGISLTNSAFSVFENQTNLLVTVIRSNANSGDVTVNFATLDQTAISGQDYLATNGLLTFLNGETEKSFLVPILDNPLVQGERTFVIQLSNPTGGAQLLEPSAAVATILDDDAGLRFSSGAYEVVENEVLATITVLRENFTNSTVSVDFSTEDGSGIEGVDYVGNSGTLVFTNGETSKTFTVGLVDDTILKGDRTVLLKLFNVVGNAGIVPPGAATLLIRDDDGSLVIPAGTALVSESNGNGVIDPDETVTVLFGLRNSAGTNALNVTSTLLATNGVTPVTTVQNYGALPVGGPVVSRPFSFTANATNGQAIAATFTLRDNGTVIGTAQFNFSVGMSIVSFTNGSPITITDRGGSPAPVGATPYPSSITINGFNGVVGKLTVTLSNLTHLSAGDIGALLVSPAGQKTLLMANAGGFNTLNNVTLAFDDAAAGSLPSGSAFGSGTYKPSSFTPLPPFPIPAPAAPYTTTLSAFNGINPNGVWSLFLIDDTSPGAGVVSNGWSMSISRQAPVPAAADLSLAASVTPESGTAGALRTYTLLVTNHGPATATSVVVTNILPAGSEYVSGSTGTGSVTNLSGVVRWSVGSLANGATASLTLVAMPTVSGVATNLAFVGSAVNDVHTNNNAVTLITTVGEPRADLVMGMFDSPDPAPAGFPVTYLVTVTNLGPSVAENVTVTNPVPAGMSFNSVIASQGAAGISGSTVWASLGTIAAGNHATVTLVLTPNAAGTFTNTASALSTVPDPLKANNVFSVKTVVTSVIAAEANGSGIRITTPGIPGTVLDSTPSLTPPVIWTPMMTNPPAVLDLPASGDSRFFRVRPGGS